MSFVCGGRVLVQASQAIVMMVTEAGSVSSRDPILPKGCSEPSASPEKGCGYLVLCRMRGLELEPVSGSKVPIRT